MRRYLGTILLFGILLHGAGAMAGEPTPSRHALAEELLLQLGVNHFVDRTMLELAKTQRDALVTMGAHDEAEELTEEFSEKLWTLVRTEMSWQKMKDLYVALYADAFNDEELKELIAFYRSPVGRKYLEKAPMLTQRSIEIGEESARRLMPDMKALIDSAMRERNLREEEKSARENAGTGTLPHPGTPEAESP